MPAQTPQEFFLHELADLYDAEQINLEVLPMLADDVDDDRVRSAFREHESETRQQIQNLERCFEILSAEPQRGACHAMQGLRKERDDFIEMNNPPQSVLTLFDLLAGAKMEHYEIASYRGLTTMAQQLGHPECARLLEANLRQEEEMAQRIERMSRDLGERLRETR
jgi:ferritin-like metal-binding protein YciE